MKKVLIGTPAYDGRLDAWYVNSLINTIRESEKHNVSIHPIFLSYDSLVQRARNDLFRIAVENDYDSLFFLDSDIEWEPEWFFKFLERPEPIIGAALVKKSDNESYTVKLIDKNLKYSEDKILIEADGVGTGFLKVDRFALEKLWEESDPYVHDGVNQRMVFNILINDEGDLVSEDFIMCYKWRKLGYKIWLDPSVTCNHIGVKKYKGNINEFLNKNKYV
jgi:hypothetical protein